MEEDGNDLDDIFGEYENDNEGNADNNEGNANTADDEQTRERVAPPKRAVKNPRLKFNAERLCGERGIPVLANHFKDVKFKGKGHEVEDLNKLMSTLEHWCHRLYPSMKLEDCLRQIEKLGKKRPVQTCLRKIRLDMPILNSDFVRDEDENETEEIQTELDVEIPPQDAFDKLISQTPTTSYEPLISTPLPRKTVTENKLGTYGSTLTEEQRKRMEYNKMLAAERRKARLTLMQSTSIDSIDHSREIFTNTQSPTFGNVDQNNSQVNEDSPIESMSLLGQQTTEPQLISTVEGGSEELGLDDLVDLVDEGDAPEANSEKEVAEDSANINSQNKQQIEMSSEELELDDLVDLVDEDDAPATVNEVIEDSLTINSHINRQIEVVDNNDGKRVNKERCDVIDLENERVGNLNSFRKQQIEVVHLDNENEPSNKLGLSEMETDEIHVLDENEEVANLNEENLVHSMDVE